MKLHSTALAVAAGLTLAVMPARATPLNFNTFVPSSAISSVTGQTNVIGFNYAGSFFIGSLYFGSNNNRLYSTDLSGGNVQFYGGPIPGATGEVVVAAGLGQSGFAKGAIYAGSQASGQIWYVPASGAPSLFASIPGSNIRQILFDPGSSFGGNMLVTTSSGGVYKIDSSHNVSLLAAVGEDTEGMDIAPAAWGALAGQLLVASENSGTIRAISPGGAVTPVASGIPNAETVSAVPSSFSVGGSPTEGFYVANYANDIRLADYTQFLPYESDVIVTSEFGGNSPTWLLTYSGGTVSVNPNPIGYLPNQSEDGIFVSRQRVTDLVPEPASMAVLGIGLAALGAVRRRR